MVTWEQFEAWMRTHDLPTPLITRIEIVPTAGGGVHLRAEAVKVDDGGRPIVRQPESEALTEVLVRPLIYLPCAEPPQQT